MLTSTNGLPFSGAWITCSRIIAPGDDCNGPSLPPALMVSPCMVRWIADCRQSDCLPFIRRAGRRLAQRQ